MEKIPLRIALTAAVLIAFLTGPAVADVTTSAEEQTFAQFQVNVLGTGAGTAYATAAASFISVPGTLTGDTGALATLSGNPHDAAVLGYGEAWGGFSDTLTVVSQPGNTTPVHFTGELLIAGTSNCLTGTASGGGDRCLNAVSNPTGLTYSDKPAVENLLSAFVGVTDITDGNAILGEGGFSDSFVNAGDVLISLPLSFYAAPGDQLGLSAALDLGSFVSWEYPGSMLTGGLATLDLVANLYLATPPGTSFISESGATYIPEPESLALLGAGLLGLCVLRRRRASPPAEVATRPSVSSS